MHIFQAISLSIFHALFLLFPFLFLAKRKGNGGHKWTRNIDLTLIRRAL